MVHFALEISFVHRMCEYCLILYLQRHLVLLGILVHQSILQWIRPFVIWVVPGNKPISWREIATLPGEKDRNWCFRENAKGAFSSGSWSLTPENPLKTLYTTGSDHGRDCQPTLALPESSMGYVLHFVCYFLKEDSQPQCLKTESQKKIIITWTEPW